MPKALFDQTPVFSLSRFFHEKNLGRNRPALPCWAAGRFYPLPPSKEMEPAKAKPKSHGFNPLGRSKKTARKTAAPLFHLKSQGLSLLCAAEEEMPLANEGDWLAAEIEKFSGKTHFIKRWRVLSPRKAPFSPEGGCFAAARGWALFLRAVRDFFQSKGLESVETPSLVQCPGTEPHLTPFQTEWVCEGRREAVFLPTSPEMNLKKLLCRGGTDIFEIKKCFRNGERSGVHEPEFYLLEWYRAFWSLDSLMNELLELLEFLSEKKFFKGDLKPPAIFSVKELFQKFLDFSLSPAAKKEDLAALAEKRGIIRAAEDFYSWEDLFHLLFLNFIEPKLPFDRPVIVKHYPPPLRAFAKISEDGWAERFELYWRGFELANAFYEVTDRREQEILFQEHLSLRPDFIPPDRELLSLMDRGMPPCSGIALGLERLFLALSGKKRLSEIRLFRGGAG